MDVQKSAQFFFIYMNKSQNLLLIEISNSFRACYIFLPVVILHIQCFGIHVSSLYGPILVIYSSIWEQYFEHIHRRFSENRIYFNTRKINITLLLFLLFYNLVFAALLNSDINIKAVS